ncbi:MAG: LLM class flavin-dependent oxidoreductase [Rhodospirillales bacterium]|nr:LLM class flavin-dependent oxidoreductase [Rhodospirillales bacterium]
MKFGLMTQIQMPRPWGPDPEVTAYANAVAQAEAADAAGFHYFWITEQHFFLEIGHSACPDMLLSAISQRTRQIRLGFSVVLMTVNNPFAIAERVATLDALSNGRVDFGMGRGSTPYMVEAFGVDRASERERADEATQAVMRMFAEDPFTGFKGKYFDLPQRHVLPRVVQKPHPPLWVAASNLSSYERAGRQGMGVIGVTRNSIGETRDAIRSYRSAIRGADPKGFVGAYPNEQVAGFALACCHEDDRTGRDIACAAARWYNGENDSPLNPVRFATAGGVDAVVDKFRTRSNEQLIEDGMAIGGNADTVSRVVEKWAEAGMDQMIFLLQAGRITQDQVMRSIELIGEKVIPRFASKGEAAAA